MKLNFLETVRRSISDPQFYDEVRSHGGGGPIAILTILIVIGTAFSAIVFGLQLQDLRNIDLEKEIADRYPDELVIEIEGGIASTSVRSPYFIDDPELTPTPTSSPRHLAVIDTRPDVPFSEIVEYDAVAVLGQRTLFIFNPSPNRTDDRNFDLSSVDDVRITKASLQELASRVTPWVRMGIYLFPLLIWVVLTAVSLIAYIFFALLGGLLVKAIARFKGFSLDYGAAFVTALYALIPVLIFDILTDLAGFGFLNSFWLGALIFALIVANNLRKLPASSNSKCNASQCVACGNTSI